jgi:predicted metal-dependent HD superfamily phosphohydrolase
VVAPLSSRWQQRWEQTRDWLSLGPIFIPIGDRLFERYSEPGRHYHDGRHVLACLKALDQYPGKIGNTNAIELALWYHDAIYDPRASDNEVQSAKFFRSEFQAFASGVEKVENLILATRHGCVEPECADSALMIDIDLAILGADPARYQIYAEDIRKEYSHVADQPYREGRLAILKGFLRQKKIYHTRHFRKLLEDQARTNLVAEIEALSSTASRPSG